MKTTEKTNEIFALDTAAFELTDEELEMVTGAWNNNCWWCWCWCNNNNHHHHHNNNNDNNNDNDNNN